MPFAPLHLHPVSADNLLIDPGTHAPSVGPPPSTTLALCPRQMARSACLRWRRWKKIRKQPLLAGACCPPHSEWSITHFMTQRLVRFRPHQVLQMLS